MKKNILMLSFIIFLSGDLCMGQGYPKESVRKNNEAVELLRRFPKTEDVKKAIRLLEESVAIDSTYRLGYINMIQSMMRLGEMENALEIANVASRHIPEDADLYFLKGVLLAKLHKRALSDEMFQKSIILMEKKLEYDFTPSISVKKSLAKAFKGDKYIAFIELLAAQTFFYDTTFDLNIWKIYQGELKYISDFDRNKEVREFWTLGEIAEKGKYVIDYDR